MRDWVRLVSEAVSLARLSPCRSKRGVLVFDHAGRQIGGGWNDQPKGFACDGSEDCKKSCGRTAVHAEQSAILSSDISRLLDGSLLHVKAVNINGEYFASSSGDPSCLECSKLILRAGLRWVYLLHRPSHTMGTCITDVPGFISETESPGFLHLVRYEARDFHRHTAKGKSIELIEVGPQVAHASSEEQQQEG